MRTTGVRERSAGVAKSKSGTVVVQATWLPSAEITGSPIVPTRRSVSDLADGDL